MNGRSRTGATSASISSASEIDAAPAAVGLDRLGDPPVAILSGGEFQRLPLARALIHRRREIWRFMRRSDNVVRMATASYLQRPAVEPLSPGLLEEFGPAVGDDRLKQMIGHMARRVMEAVGYQIEQPRRSIRITRENLFSSGARYRRPGDNRARRRPPREPPRKGRVLDALRRSPLMDADVIPPRPFEPGREVEL